MKSSAALIVNLFQLSDWQNVPMNQLTYREG